VRGQLQIIAARYGETDASPYLLPISVDGLIVVASISLVELTGRIHTAETTPFVNVVGPSTVAAPAVVPAVVEPVVRVPPPSPSSPVPESTVQQPLALVPVPSVEEAQSGDELVPAPELVARARAIAVAHRRTNRTDITPEQLAGYMRVTPQLAAVLYGLVLNDTTASNGHAPIGELTR
jgi:hypothetical protein